MKRSRLRLASLASSLALSTFVSLVPIPTARAADPPPAQTAEQLGNEAYDLHAAGKYPEAIAAYFKAYELSPAAAILFNIATIYDRNLHERELAANFYRRYLVAPDAEPALVKTATERLASIKRAADEEAANAKKNVAPLPPSQAAPGPAVPPPATTPAVAPPEEPSTETGHGGTQRVVGITVAVAGVVAVGTGLVLGGIAKSKNDKANTFCNGAACTNESGITLSHQAGDFATASTATFFPGLALLAGGLITFFAAPRAAAPSKVTGLVFGPILGSTEAGVTARGEF